MTTVATPLKLDELWQGYDFVVVVDAVLSTHRPGSVTVVEVADDHR